MSVAHRNRASDEVATTTPHWTVCVLPRHITCCLFDLDGVLTSTASVHEAAWKRTFDELLARLEILSKHVPDHPSSVSNVDAISVGRDRSPFTHEEYLNYVDGRPRHDGVRRFLTARGIHIPEGSNDDRGDVISVNAIANNKNAMVIDQLQHGTLAAFPTTEPCLASLHRAGIAIGVVSASENAVPVLKSTGLSSYIQVVVDGVVTRNERLAGKPSPATFTRAAEKLATVPGHVAVFEDAIAGVAAGRAGQFALVVGIGDHDRAPALRNAGADVVIPDLSWLR